MKAADENKQKLIGCLFVGALISFGLGLFTLFWGFVFQSGALFALGPSLVFIAILMAGVALIIGFIHNKDLAGGAPRPPEEGRIVARFAINQNGEMIFDNFDYDAEEARFYARVQFLGGRREELECARPVFDQCGEGMRGMLTMHGGWLTQFEQLMDTDETRAMYRDW